MSETESHTALWHLSFDRTLESLWTPRKRAIGEPAHISVCPTIEQCVQSLYPGLGRFFKADTDLEYLILNVYRPIVPSDCTVYTDKRLTESRFVPNAHITGEHWILDPIKMVHNGRVKIYRPGGFEQSPMFNVESKGYFIYPTDIVFEWVDEEV